MDVDIGGFPFLFLCCFALAASASSRASVFNSIGEASFFARVRLRPRQTAAAATAAAAAAASNKLALQLPRESTIAARHL
jgi:hypothetical protein